MNQRNESVKRLLAPVDHPVNFGGARVASRRGRNRNWLVALIAGSLAISGLAAPIGAYGQEITTGRLLDDMTNLAGLAEFPNPAYTCKQFSSYDRKSKTPGNEDWFANGDCGQYLRVEEVNGRKEYVMMDTAGPGTIVRIWSANPAGTLRIYLDDATTPAIEAPMADVLGGKIPGWPRPISGEYSKGWNLYFPIPYARHCKVTSDAGNFYYHVNYRTYPAGVAVATFRLQELTALAGPIEKLRARLDAPREVKDDGGDSQPFEIQLAPGETVSESFSGPKAFSHCLVKVTAKSRETALRGILVKLTFDGEQTVSAPLGDLYGSAPGINPFTTLPLGMIKEGEMYCHWLMPFKDNAVVELTNTTGEPATLSGEIVLKDYQWTEASMHFHAKWRAAFDVPTRPMQDWNYLSAKGKGVFAGVSFAIDNPVKDWWGEGDEKIYVDGETFPSHFGTGTEDYYGYAWCWPGLFTHAYHSQSRCDGPANYGRTSVNRFHIIDRIPFTRDFKFDMELWHWKECKVNMAVTAYWYARPGATDGFAPIRASDAIVRPLAEYVVPRVKSALEGEAMRIIRVTGTAEPQDWPDASAGGHLWWHAGMKPGDTLAVAFAAPKAGQYRVTGSFLSARDYGIHQLAINGNKAGAPADFYSAEVKPGNTVDLGVFELKAGENEFSATIVGANPKADKAYMLGLDYLLLKPVE